MSYATNRLMRIAVAHLLPGWFLVMNSTIVAEATACTCPSSVYRQELGHCNKQSSTITSRLECILTYAGSRIDSALNYTVLLVTGLSCAYHIYYYHYIEQRSSPPAIRAAITSLVSVTSFQIGLCWAIGCTGISIIWCAMCGWILSERRQSQKEPQYILQQNSVCVATFSKSQEHQKPNNTYACTYHDTDNAIGDERLQPLLGPNPRGEKEREDEGVGIGNNQILPSARSGTTTSLNFLLEKHSLSITTRVPSENSLGDPSPSDFQTHQENSLASRKHRLENIVLMLNAGTIVYYFVTSEFITTVAHICALVLGALCSILSISDPQQLQHEVLSESNGDDTQKF